MTEREWLTSDDPAAMLSAVGETAGDHPDRAFYGQAPHRAGDRKLRLFACAAARLDPLWPRWAADSPPKRSVARVEACVEAGQPNHNFNDRDSRDLGFFWAVSTSLEAARLMADGPERAALAALMREVVGNPFVVPVTPLYDSGGVSDRYTHPNVSWLTPTVLSLARAAYDERPGRVCPECWDLRLKWPPNPWRCPTCRNTGRIDDGALDPFRFALLADALEEAGCPAEACEDCGGLRTRCEHTMCAKCGGWIVPHPVLGHLRSPGTHVRGCHVLDALLGKS